MPVSVSVRVRSQVNVLEPGSECRKCRARGRMQQKYLDDIDVLYGDDLHVTRMPLLEGEVRGVERISKFAGWLLRPDEARRVAEEGEDCVPVKEEDKDS